jgi:hypothetical protein
MGLSAIYAPDQCFTEINKPRSFDTWPNLGCYYSLRLHLETKLQIAGDNSGFRDRTPRWKTAT